MKFYYLLFLILLFSCGEKGREERLKERVDSFATAYFNFRFDRAAAYTTEESERWLRYLASNVQQEDVDAINDMERCATIRIDEVSCQENDTNAKVRITVNDFLQMDTIGTRGKVVKRAQFTISVVYRDENWLVRMEAPLRSEK